MCVSFCVGRWVLCKSETRKPKLRPESKRTQLRISPQRYMGFSKRMPKLLLSRFCRGIVIRVILAKMYSYVRAPRHRRHYHHHHREKESRGILSVRGQTSEEDCSHRRCCRSWSARATQCSSVPYRFLFPSTSQRRPPPPVGKRADCRCAATVAAITGGRTPRRPPCAPRVAQRLSPPRFDARHQSAD